MDDPKREVPKREDSKREDLKPEDLRELSWREAEREASLEEVYRHVCTLAEKAIGWYQKAKRPKKLYARWLRGLSIFLFAVAGLFPIVAQVWKPEPEDSWALLAEPGWASIVFGVATLLLAFDRFLDLSSGWIRYIAAELKLQRLLCDFRISWQMEKASWKGEPPGDGQVQRALGMARGFRNEVNQVVLEETNRWIEEFQKSLKELDEALKARAEAAATGALNVTVTNGGDFKDGWDLSVDAGAPKKCLGVSAAVSPVAPGHHTVTVEGRLDGVLKRAEKAVVVAPGGVRDVELTLA